MIKLQNYRWMPTGEVKGTVQFINGFGDYCARYAYLGEMFAQNGYEFIGFDQRGMGYSEGRKGIYEDQRSVIED